MMGRKITGVASPQTIAEALEMLRKEGRVRIVAGGTDMLPKLRRGQFESEELVSLGDVEELKGVRRGNGEVVIGAMTTLSQLAAAPELAEFRAVYQAVSEVASPVIRNSGTVGGNLLQDTRCKNYDRNEHWRAALGYCLKCGGDTCRVAPGSDRCRAAFSSDLAPAFMVHGATVTFRGDEEREVELRALYREDGAAHLDVTEDEILVDVRLPERVGRRSSYTKLRARGGIDFPELGLAVSVRELGDGIVELRAAAGGVMSSVPYLTVETDRDSVEDFVEEMYRAVKPVDTTHLAPLYRKRAVRTYLRRALDELL